MKILLIGEFSNLHWTLAEGLRALGHEVCVVSDGNHWKNYKRDITQLRPTNNKIDGIKSVSNTQHRAHESYRNLECPLHVQK